MIRLLLLTLWLSLAVTGTASSAEVLHRGIGAEPETLDPHRATGLIEAAIFYDLYEGLLARGADGRSVPALADSWEVAPDRLSVTFYLRRGAKWSDGTPVRADDVVFSFRRLVDPSSGSRNGHLAWPIKFGRSINEGRIGDPSRLGVIAVDDMTVRFLLEEPTPYFVDMLSYPMLAVLPQAKVVDLGREFFRPGNLVSAGSYRLAEVLPRRHVRLERNPFHYDSHKIAIPVVFHHVAGSSDTDVKRFRARELHTTYELSPDQISWARANVPSALRIDPLLSIYFLAPNLSREPWKSKPGLRHALSMVIDRQDLTARVSAGGEMPSLSFVPTTVSHYSPVKPAWADWTMEQRIAEAQKRLAEAGYPGGAGLELDILYNNTEQNRRVMTAIAASFKQHLGIDVTLTPQEWKTYISTWRSLNFPGLTRGGVLGPYDDPNAFLEFMRSAIGPENLSGYQNRAFDALIAASQREPDRSRRMAMLQRAEQMVLDDAAIIPLFVPTRIRLVDPRLFGWVANTVDAHPSRYLSFRP